MRYMTNGFQPASIVDNLGVFSMAQANETITAGDAVHSDGTGYLTNTNVDFASTFLGVAAADSDNDAGADGDLDCRYIPANARQVYWVKAGETLLVEIDHVGTTVNLSANDSINPGDTTCLYYGFLILKVDVSTAAIAANEYGFAKGYFVNTADES